MVLSRVERRELPRRETDFFLEDLGSAMEDVGVATVFDALDIALAALFSRGYVAPRVYRQEGSTATLIQGLHLPSETVHGETRFSASNATLEAILEKGQLFQVSNVDEHPELLDGARDPLRYISERGLVGVPYRARSRIDQTIILGAIIASYNPAKRTMDSGELDLLCSVGRMVGRQIRGLYDLELALLARRETELLRRENDELSGRIKKYRRLALTDALTGLPNYRKFQRDLQRFYQRGLTGASYYLLRLDGDHFKQINDTLGHDGGDEFISNMGRVLKEVKEARQETLRAYRLGGDEFAAFIETDDPAELRDVCEEIRLNVKKIPLPGSGLAPRSVSIGIAAVLSFGTTLTWAQRADLALYEAKARGRDGYVLYGA